MARHESFAFETTLAGHGYARMIPGWRAAGWHVKLLFLSLPSPEMAIMRVAGRVAQGGHAVPEKVIRRRFATGWRNFREIYVHRVDSWMLYDNSGDQPVIMESGEDS